MPTMTASTITLMPELTTLPSTRSARKLVRFQKANGTRMKPASEVSLNSRIVTNICTARMKKARMTITQAISSTMIVRKLSKKPVKVRSEEHTSELQSLMRISYAVFCLKKKKQKKKDDTAIQYRQTERA